MADTIDKPIITRKQALQRGLKRYFTGKPCWREGHIAERNAKYGRCVECNKDNLRKLRKDDHPRYSAYQKKHKIAGYNATRKWIKSNPEKTKNHKKKDYRKHKEKRLLTCRKWAENNKELTASYHRNRKAKIKKSKGTHTAKQVKELLERQKYKCAECHCRIAFSPKDGDRKLHVDHVMPIALGGENDIKNLQCLCEPCNLGKSDKHPIQWARENGRLL